ncbi:MAG: RNA methyltransferase [Patescibacteria group bacterium]
MIKNKLYVVLDNIRSRENVGSIFRTADAAGVSKIYLCGITPAPPHEKISKTALGAEKWIPWEYHKQTWRLLSSFAKATADKEKLKIVALEQTKKSMNIFKFKKPKNYSIVLVVGNEVKGLSPKILKYCDDQIFIPMYGKKESLNVSVATGIALYQLLR